METLLGQFNDYDDEDYQIIKAPFAYPGGKERSIMKLRDLLPIEKGWIDCCGGSGIVTLNRGKSDFEVFNDRWSALSDFFLVVQDDEMLDQLLGLLDVSIHSREIWEWAHVAQHDCSDRVKRVFAWYYNLTYSFSSLGRNFGRSRRGSTLLAKKIDKKLSHFYVIQQRFKHVQVENLSVIQCLKDYDDIEHVFYIDPPYYPESPGIYKHSMKKADHIKMLDQVFKTHGFVAVSGYANDLYDDYPWDSVHTWESMVTMKSRGEERNNKQHEMDHKREYANETLWIKEAHA